MSVATYPGQHTYIWIFFEIIDCYLARIEAYMSMPNLEIPYIHFGHPFYSYVLSETETLNSFINSINCAFVMAGFENRLFSS